MNDIKTLFAKNLKRLRESSGLSQAELANELGKSASYINQLESGKKGFTSESLEKYSEALRAPYQEFVRADEIDIVEGIRTFFISLDDLMAKLKAKRIEILKEKKQGLSTSEIEDDFEASDELIGRLGLLRASVEDHFKFFFGIESSIFTRKKPRLKNYSLVFNFFKNERFDITKNAEGEETWAVKEEYMNKLFRESSNEEMLADEGKEPLFRDIVKALPALNEQQLDAVAAFIGTFKSPKPLESGSTGTDGV